MRNNSGFYLVSVSLCDTLFSVLFHLYVPNCLYCKVGLSLKLYFVEVCHAYGQVNTYSVNNLVSSYMHAVQPRKDMKHTWSPVKLVCTSFSVNNFFMVNHIITSVTLCLICLSHNHGIMQQVHSFSGFFCSVWFLCVP